MTSADEIFRTADTCCRSSQGVLVLSLEQPRPTITADVLQAIERALADTERAGTPLVITTSGRNFAFGAMLHAMDAAMQGEPAGLDAELHRYQQTMLRLRHASVPTVAATRGVAISGGCELLMHCTRVVAHTDSRIGLAEASIGVVPAGGGLKEFARRAASTADPSRTIAQSFATVAAAKVSQTASEARRLGFLSPADVTTDLDPLGPAIELAVALQVQGHVSPPRDPRFKVAGSEVRDQLLALESQRVAAGESTAHQLEVSRCVAHVLCSGGAADEERSEAELFALERRHFIALVQMELTQARIAHVRSTGKVLVN